MKFLVKATLIFILSAFVLVPVQAEAKSYEFTDLDIQATVREDGSVQVSERRTVRFDGTFSGMFQWIDTSGGISVRDITVEENGVPYRRNPRTDPGPAGTFFVRQDPGSVYVDWSFSAANETRTFTLNYTLTNVVKVYRDVAELYIKFVGEEWDHGVDNVRVTLYLPPGATKDEIRAWGHGPLQGTVEILNGETVLWQVAALPAETFLEGRVTFPTRLVPNATRRLNEDGLKSILAEEERWARQSNLRRLLARVDWILGILFFIGSVVGAIWSWSLWGKEFTPTFDGDYYRELPGDYSPAEMSFLYNFGRVTPKDLTATLLDLARRGFVSIEEVKKESKGIFRRGGTDYMVTQKKQAEGKGTLRLHERELLDFLFAKVDRENDDRVSFDEIEAYAKKRAQSFTTFWSAWQGLVKEEAEKHGFFDTGAMRKRIWQFVIAGSVLILAFPAFVVGMIGSGVSLILSGIVLLIGAIGLRRRSKYGVDQFAQWRAFRRFLLHFSEMQRHEIPSLVIWEHYLVYAVSLGVAKQVLKQLQLVFPNMHDGTHRFGYGWYYYGAFTGPGNLDNSLSNLTSSIESSFQQSISAARSKMSSGSGRGGGFSGGGGGGFGGGGGGAR